MLFHYTPKIGLENRELVKSNCAAPINAQGVKKFKIIVTNVTILAALKSHILLLVILVTFLNTNRSRIYLGLFKV